MVNEQQYFKGTCNACQSFVSWRSSWENIIIKHILHSHEYFSIPLGKTSFTSERFLNQADLARDERWRHKANVALKETRILYETLLYSCIVLSIYEQLSLNFYFSISPEWLYILLFEFKPVFDCIEMPNRENCLLYEFSQMCKTFCI